MKVVPFILTLLFAVARPVILSAQIADSSQYLGDIKQVLKTEWPKSNTINLVFHGHSVPAGYWENHEVHTLESYPNLLLKKLKEKFPYAVINIIVTAIGGEGSIKGETRFENEVLIHKPDILFIDYALNDRFAPIDKTREAMEKMIKMALSRNIKVVLLTPSPDQRIDISDPSNPLDPYVVQIRNLAKQYRTGLADPYVKFQKIIRNGGLKDHMASVNHPNMLGHEVIAGELFKWF
jgi:acyl-CoA thioesterase I